MQLYTVTDILLYVHMCIRQGAPTNTVANLYTLIDSIVFIQGIHKHASVSSLIM